MPILGPPAQPGPVKKARAQPLRGVLKFVDVSTLYVRRQTPGFRETPLVRVLKLIEAKPLPPPPAYKYPPPRRKKPPVGPPPPPIYPPPPAPPVPSPAPIPGVPGGPAATRGRPPVMRLLGLTANYQPPPAQPSVARAREDTPLGDILRLLRDIKFPQVVPRRPRTPVQALLSLVAETPPVPPQPQLTGAAFTPLDAILELLGVPAVKQFVFSLGGSADVASDVGSSLGGSADVATGEGLPMTVDELSALADTAR